MHQYKDILANKQAYQTKLSDRGYELDIQKLEQLVHKLNSHKTNQEALNNQRNEHSKSIGIAKSRGEDISTLIAQSTSFNEQIQKIKKKLGKAQKKLNNFLLDIPNIAHHSVPVGQDENHNTEIDRNGIARKFDFEIQNHIDLGERTNQLNFNLSAKLAGSRFVCMKGGFARLHRALINFMLSSHINNGYEEVYIPYLVNRETLIGTGQLPKFEEDLFKTSLHSDEHENVVEGKRSKKNFYLIPTAEVPLTNLVSNCILDESDLPIRYVAHSPCFRSEAGSYGRDVRGLIRQHQFEKVEMVHIAHPKKSYEQLEAMLKDAQSILKALDLPYRTLCLCTGDMGFSAAKTYDLEVWVPSQNAYREISSCSNTESFQAKRMKARYKDKTTGNNEFVHTLNGSGLAVGRALLAIVENYQNKDGSITIPEVLRSYMNNQTLI